MSQESAPTEAPSATALNLVSGLLADATAMARSRLASPADIDTAMQLGAGHPVGPLAFLSGLDPQTRARHGLAEPPPADTVSDRSDQVHDDGAWDHPVGIAGTGTMASGITEALLRAGVPTVVLARSHASAERLRAGVAASMDGAVAKGRLAASDRDRALSLLEATTRPDDLAGCGHVIEAVAEHRDTKRELLARLDATLPESAVLATNTSSLTVGEIRADLPERRTVIALHFFNPAKAMKLVEVVGAAQDAAVLDTAGAWVRRIGKVPVRCGDERGFVVNRLLIPYLNDAVRALDTGAFTAAEADALMRRALGHPMGPFELIDLIGTDVTAAAQTMLYEASGDPRLKPADGLLKLVAEGRLGRKSGSGFHDHTPSSSRSTA